MNSEFKKTITDINVLSIVLRNVIIMVRLKFEETSNCFWKLEVIYYYRKPNFSLTFAQSSNLQ